MIYLKYNFFSIIEQSLLITDMYNSHLYLIHILSSPFKIELTNECCNEVLCFT